jgi:S-adenosylmethionine/arginine decarboxylase-like enzyme
MWGYHLSIDCAGCNESISDETALKAFSDDLVGALGMRAHGAPLAVRFGDDPKVTGYTLVQLIETSNITGHFCDYSAEAYIDVFSCKRFAVETVRQVIDRHFAPRACKTSYRERQAPLLADATTDKIGRLEGRRLQSR